MGSGATYVPRPCAARYQHAGLRRSHGGWGRRTPVLGDPRPARPEIQPKALSEHVCCGLQHGPLPTLLVSLAGPPVPCVWPPWASKRPQEGPHRPAGGLSPTGCLVLLGSWQPRGPVPGRELPGAARQVLGILQGRLVCVACCTAGELPLCATPVPSLLHQWPDTGLGHIHLLPEVPGEHIGQTRHPGDSSGATHVSPKWQYSPPPGTSARSLQHLFGEADPRQVEGLVRSLKASMWCVTRPSCVDRSPGCPTCPA